MSTSPTPLSSIRTPHSFAGDTVDVFFGPAEFSAPEDNSIDPSTLTAPISEGFNAYEKAQFGTAFDLIEQYIDLSFETVSSRSDADFSLVLDTDQFTASTLAYFYLPNGAEQYGVFNGNEWDRAPGGDLEVGGNGWTLLQSLRSRLFYRWPQAAMGAARSTTSTVAKLRWWTALRL